MSHWSRLGLALIVTILTLLAIGFHNKCRRAEFDRRSRFQRETDSIYTECKFEAEDEYWSIVSKLQAEARRVQDSVEHQRICEIVDSMLSARGR